MSGPRRRPDTVPIALFGDPAALRRKSVPIASADVTVVMIPSAVYVAECKPNTAEALAHLFRTGTGT